MLKNLIMAALLVVGTAGCWKNKTETNVEDVTEQVEATAEEAVDGAEEMAEDAAEAVEDAVEEVTPE